MPTLSAAADALDGRPRTGAGVRVFPIGPGRRRGDLAGVAPARCSQHAPVRFRRQTAISGCAPDQAVQLDGHPDDNGPVTAGADKRPSACDREAHGRATHLHAPACADAQHVVSGAQAVAVVREQHPPPRLSQVNLLPIPRLKLTLRSPYWSPASGHCRGFGRPSTGFRSTVRRSPPAVLSVGPLRPWLGPQPQCRLNECARASGVRFEAGTRGDGLGHMRLDDSPGRTQPTGLTPLGASVAASLPAWRQNRHPTCEERAHMCERDGAVCQRASGGQLGATNGKPR
jgi:hypothetical protein